MLWPVMPIWRALGSQPLSVTLRVAPSSAAEQLEQWLQVVVALGRDTGPDPDHRVGVGHQVGVVVPRAVVNDHPAPGLDDHLLLSHVDGFPG